MSDKEQFRKELAERLDLSRRDNELIAGWFKKRATATLPANLTPTQETELRKILGEQGIRYTSPATGGSGRRAKIVYAETSPGGIETTATSSFWAHDWLLQQPEYELSDEDKQVLSAWEGLSSLYFDLLRGKENPNIFTRAIQSIERNSGMACGIPEALGLTEKEIEKAKEKQRVINNKEVRFPLSIEQVERISAFTGLLTINALKLLEQKKDRQDIIQFMEIRLNAMSEQDILPQYKTAAAEMLEELVTDEKPLLNSGRKRAERILGAFYPVADIVTGFMARVMIKDIGANDREFPVDEGSGLLEQAPISL